MSVWTAAMAADDPEDQYADIELAAQVEADCYEEALEKAKCLPESAFHVVGAIDAVGYYIPHWSTLEVY